MRLKAIAAGALLALSLGATLAFASPIPGAPGCPVFPADNPWNRPVDTLPVTADSATIINSIGASTGLHPDFGAGLWQGQPIGIPYNVVPKTTRKSKVTFDYADESDPGPYPIPAGVKIEGGSDRHALIVDKDTCTLYELFGLQKQRNGWHAGSGAIWSLKSNALRPEGWTSADAAGLPILAGLARYDEAAQNGEIDHALRFTMRRTQRAFIHPATHYASSLTDPALPPMGLRVRLKASYDVSRFTGASRAVVIALQRFGMIVADNGSDWFVGGATDSRWNDAELDQLKTVPASAFEVVQTGPIVR
jgi:hypothetical protein